jgi:flagellar motor component MotA
MSCNAVKKMDYTELLEYLSEVWEEMWDATMLKLENMKKEGAIKSRPHHNTPFLFPIFGDLPKK